LRCVASHTQPVGKGHSPASILLDGATSNIFSDAGTTNALAGFTTNAAGGSFAIQNGRNFTTAGASSSAGSLTVGSSSTFTVNGAYTQTGTLFGSGTITANTTSSGQVFPGANGAAGTLTVNGNYTQSTAGTLNIDIGGLNAGSQYDQVNLGSGNVASLRGTLNFKFINGFTPSLGQSFTIMNFGSRMTDRFDTVTVQDVGGGHTLVPDYSIRGD
jgi:hypothetical protein